MTTVDPAGAYGTRLPAIALPPTDSLAAPPLPLLVTVMRYSAPRHLRVMVNLGTSLPMQGFTSRPPNSGRTPSMYCELATKFHAAVPVSHEFFASPGFTASLPAIICE